MPELKRNIRHEITLVLNGAKRTGHAEPRMLLSDFLRHELGATGVHVGCEHGVCGACTVQMDGAAVRSCLCFAVQAEGCEIVTVEGLAGIETPMSSLQQAMKRHHALQCGFCTAGILMTMECLIAERPQASDDEIRDALSGHLCRCTGYSNIVRAVRDALNGGKPRGKQGNA